jgi:hypothetical protein
MHPDLLSGTGSGAGEEEGSIVGSSYKGASCALLGTGTSLFVLKEGRPLKSPGVVFWVASEGFWCLGSFRCVIPLGFDLSHLGKRVSSKRAVADV